MEVDAPRVGIVMGSKSDMPAMEKAAKELEERGIRHEVRVMSAHRDPDMVADYAKNAQDARPAGDHRRRRAVGRAAGRGRRAHRRCRSSACRSRRRSRSRGGLDALLSIAQMPPGVPVACVGVDNARNAAVLAARILDC